MTIVVRFTHGEPRQMVIRNVYLMRIEDDRFVTRESGHEEPRIFNMDEIQSIEATSI